MVRFRAFGIQGLAFGVNPMVLQKAFIYKYIGETTYWFKERIQE